jgi:hypothetical protein
MKIAHNNCKSSANQVIVELKRGAPSFASSRRHLLGKVITIQEFQV